MASGGGPASAAGTGSVSAITPTPTPSALTPSNPVPSVPAASVPAAGPGETVANLRRLKRGMAENEAWAILGQPERSEDTGAAKIFYLKEGSLVFFQQGKLVNAVLSTGESLDDPDSLK
jgi:hypothetical protein